MKLRVLIVDDEPLAADWLQRLLAEIPEAEVVGVATDGDLARDEIAAHAPDLVLLDIQMPGPDGLQVARDNRAGGPDIVFVTAFPQRAAEAFELDAVDYLLKPVTLDRLRDAFNRATRRRRLAALDTAPGPVAAGGGDFLDAFWVRKREGQVRVTVAEIDWIEADRDYALLHTATRTHIVRIRMQELEQNLDPGQLLRVHRGAFVRPTAVVAVEGRRRGAMRLRLADGALIDVGASYVERTRQMLGFAGVADTGASSSPPV